MEDFFDLLIVANLTDDDEESGKPKRVYADQVGFF